MYVEQIYTNCLAQGSYYIESNGEAAVIDPIRESQPYIDLAESRGAKIKYVFETHFHADFVSGHIDLANKVGAQIIYGPGAETAYEIYNGKDGELFNIGESQIKLLHTPGHTPESSCYLLLDKEGKPHSVFTGDTLFVGDVGRPDLAIKSGYSQADLASLLYDSLRNKLLTLPDEVVLYPGHGAGSSCGKNLSSETVSSIGEQRRSNYALQDMSKEEFIEEITDGLLAPPPYFFADAHINKNGYKSLDDVMKSNLKALSLDDFQNRPNEAIVLDVRNKEDFAEAHVPKSIFIGLDGNFALWVGAILPMDKPLYLVSPKGKEEEAVRRLARVGFENVSGYLDGGFETYASANLPTEQVQNVSAETAVEMLDTHPMLDVRKPGEIEAAHVEGVQNIRLQELVDLKDQIENVDQPHLLHCASGYRSVIAISLLQREGIMGYMNVVGGFQALEQVQNVKVKTGLCATQRRANKLDMKA